jgi:homoserine kinase
LAFAQGMGELLETAMADRIHQPYRAAICPQLSQLLPLAGRDGILGVALSGAGPAVLAIVDGERHVTAAREAICAALAGAAECEVVTCRFEESGAGASWRKALQQVHSSASR